MLSLPTNDPTGQPMLSLWRGVSERVAPSGAVVAAVLSFGDVREPAENGTEVIRLSVERARREDIQLLLGSDWRRALDVSVIWDDREMELVEVMDRAPPEPVDDLCGEGYARAKMREYPRSQDL